MKYILCWARQKFCLFVSIFLPSPFFVLSAKKQTEKLGKSHSEEWNTSQLNSHFLVKFICRKKLSFPVYFKGSSGMQN